MFSIDGLLRVERNIMAVTRKPKKVLVQFLIAFVVALIFGVVAVGLGFSFVSGVMNQAQVAKSEAAKLAAEAEAEKRRLKAEQDAQHQAIKTYKVVQALTNLAPGQAITQDMVTLVASEDKPPAGTLGLISQALGKVVKAPIVQGEPLDSSKILDTGGYIIVRDGMRAITFSVDMIGGLNGAIVPGSHVDILTSVGQDDKVVTETLLQNVEVAGVGSGAGSARAAASADGGLPVTVIVTPQQAQKLTLASGLGKFHLTLRNFSDRRHLKIQSEDLTGLMTGLQSVEKIAASAKAGKKASGSASDGFHNVNYAPESSNLPSPASSESARSKYTMQIYRGTGTESVDFQQ